MKFFLTFFILLSSAPVWSDEYLIQEMSKLRSSLAKDDPDYFELSLRLADLYFDESIQESDDRIKVTEQRNNALSLYSEALKLGRVQNFPARKEIIVKFQMGRVLGKLGKYKEALKYFNEVYASKEVTKRIKREVTFRLAEYWEEQVHFAQADRYYKEAIELCESVTSCNYAHYRRAWLHYRDLKLDSAIEELKLSLFEKDGMVREKVINDLLLFYSNQSSNGKDALKFITELEKKTKRDDLVQKLVEAYYSAGNRIAGSNALIFLNDRKPDSFYEMRLLEESYGFRDIDEVKKYLSAIEKRKIKDIPRGKEESKEFRAMLKRVIVQFDSESESDDRYFDILKRSIMSYLSFFPNDESRIKMQQGWLKVESDKVNKVSILKKWISEEKDKTQLRKLRQTRLALAQELKKPKIVIEEALAIAALLKGSTEAREFSYVAAYEYYKEKKHKKALDLFLPLTEIKNKKTIDKWAIQSQNLVLDIYNQRKNFQAIAVQANKWLSLDLFTANPKLTKDIADMKLVATQADFEKTTALGETKQALDGFYKFCFDNIFPEKSCPNAKVLAVKLADQSKLIALLEKNNDEQALMTEYELMGEFSKAASLQEKFLLNKQADLTVYFKIALLYEIDGNLSQRDRVLKKLISKIRSTRQLDKKYEKLLYLTLDEADMLSEQSLVLPWSVETKVTLANRFSQSKKAKKLLTSGDHYTGPTWSKYVLKESKKLFDRQKKVSFYGRNSQKLFKRRVYRLNKLNDFVKKYLNGADSQTRIYLLNTVKMAYQNFSVEILSTPIPEGLTEEIYMQVQVQLTDMAAPYQKIALDYERLLDEQLATVSKEEKLNYLAQIAEPEKNYAILIKDFEYKDRSIASFDFKSLDAAKSKLKANPLDDLPLKEMHTAFTTAGFNRVASYFKGRIKTEKETL